ncbi:hypothetical protein HELRODRAFT_164277 [Helobdella robusta]|uniref:Uncharacterized protein n=1 Tax=Helobdella robusta TaxID=6412 RepID=T1EV72_HELRO|nr:hypothetical protein HELRODRAFT_164277 [Helobdella robusta]ESN94437.1 hypothetical protein HELRODRAFT_164277 [Helobdella robusta]
MTAKVGRVCKNLQFTLNSEEQHLEKAHVGLLAKIELMNKQKQEIVKQKEKFIEGRNLLRKQVKQFENLKACIANIEANGKMKKGKSAVDDASDLILSKLDIAEIDNLENIRISDEERSQYSISNEIWNLMKVK